MKSPFLAMSLCWIATLVLPGCTTERSATKDASKVIHDNARGVGPRHKVIKLSSRTYNDGSDPTDEIKAFYIHLVESDSVIRQQFRSLSRDLREEYGGIYHAYEPQVLTWFPSEESWDAPEEFKTNSNYLVIQPIGYGRSKRAGTKGAIVSEFNVTDSGKTLTEDDPKDERMSTTMTITFLGFRKLQLDPIAPNK